jgi:hypothetical protein
MSYTTSANLGSPRGSVKSLKSLIPLRCHGSVWAKRASEGRLTVGQAGEPITVTITPFVRRKCAVRVNALLYGEIS